MKLDIYYRRLRDPKDVLQWTFTQIEPYDHLVVVRFKRMSGESYVEIARTLRHWCTQNYGLRGNRDSRQWNYFGPSNFGFRHEHQAMLMITVWNGYEDGSNLAR
jgi:hypothetical protein